jgi:hypothetical protein
MAEAGAAGAAGAAGNEGAAGAAGAAGAGGAPEVWTAKFEPEVKGYAELKGWKDPAEAVRSTMNMEKLLGVPADQIIRMPKADDAEGMTKVFDRLGRPAKAEDYKLTAPEGADPEFAKNASAWFHEANLTTGQAAKVIEKFNAHLAQTRQTAAETEALAVKEGAEKLNKEWGAALEKNKAIVDGVAREFGMSAEQVLGLRKALGTEGAMKFLYSIGQKLGEDTFVAANGGQKFGNVMTPDAARARITALKLDKEFSTKLMNGNVEAKAEWDRVHQFLSPETKAA